MKIIDHLQKSIRDAAKFNPEVQVAPVCILWPDRERQWEAIIPVLKVKLPELFCLGKYAPEKHIGPAIWLRLVISGCAKEVELPKFHAPIIYLPGVSRQELRAVENCPDHLKPLAELQYRGVIWSQLNAKDWTILAYLKSEQGGLGLDTAQDSDAKNAMQFALYRFLDEDLELLRGKRLDKDYFNTLLTGGDPIRDLLLWLDRGDSFRESHGAQEWKAFVEVCKSQMAFDPQIEGVLAGSTKLANHKGVWHSVWNRFCEAPMRYPNIPAQIRKCPPPNDSLLWYSGDGAFEGWPQWNEEQENNLRRDLAALADMPAHEARTKILDYEKQHGKRRSLVWAELNEAPLAFALEHLVIIAEYTKTALAAGSVEDISAGYRNYGWRADDGVIRAMSRVEHPTDIEAVKTAIHSIYLPWVEESARYLQKVIYGTSYPGGSFLTAKPDVFNSGDCVLFVDGLRFDVGKHLAEDLVKDGFIVSEELAWAALPSVTATGKAAVTPVRERIRGLDGSIDYEPSVAATGQSLKGGYQLTKLFTDAGWNILERASDGSGQGMAWYEFGDIDHEGHTRGWKLVKQIDSLLMEIKAVIIELINVGWNRIRIVTDHGWLLLPGGLPKTDLPAALIDNKWGRCTSIKPGATTEERLYPWYWNSSQYFALADGVSCYKSGEEYTHGGLSLQECLTLKLTVSRGVSKPASVVVEFTDIVWKGLRCTVAVDGGILGLALDVRIQAGDPASSVVVGCKPLKDNGTASVVVENEDMEGHDAMLVLIDANGALAAQIATVIGGGNA
jgi:hypothetical protein